MNFKPQKANQQIYEQHIIGGMFGLEDLAVEDNLIPSFLKNCPILLANASSALWLLIKLLSPSQVWLPSYLCGSILGVVTKAGVKVKFYEISSALVVASLDWLEAVRPNDLIIGIDYFGFAMDISWVAEAKSKGAWILEDASQSLLSDHVGQQADFVIFSPRKFLGVPDGGILICQQPIEGIDKIQLAPPPSDWWLKALNATLLRRQFDLFGEDRHWFKLFQEAEQSHPVGLYRMSELAQNILEQCVNDRSIARKRIENYQHLLQSLDFLAIFPSLPDGVVPLGFPIRVRDRDRIRQKLFEREIYPPVHWSIEDVVPAHFQGSHALSAEIMTLPCDQRYELKDMANVAVAIKFLLE